MTNILVAVILVITPSNLDLPPEGITFPATVDTQATRVDPPVEATAPSTTVESGPPEFSGSISGTRCVGAEPLLAYYSPGWSVTRMSQIMYRESRCQPGARNRSSSATGLLQILASHCGWLSDQMNTWCTRDRLTDPYFNIRAGAVLWKEQGYGAWQTS